MSMDVFRTEKHSRGDDVIAYPRWKRLLRCARLLIPRAIREIWMACSPWIKSDILYLKILYFLTYGRLLNLTCPKRFTEKLQALKLIYTEPLHSQMVDKYGVREIIEKELGQDYLFPLLGVWDNVDDIDFSALPEQFVLKPTHDSGSIIFCHDKAHFDISTAKKRLKKSLKRKFFYRMRELAYRGVKPRVIAEPLMVDDSGTELRDYKLLCFNGAVKYIQVHYGREHNHRRNLYTPEWKLVDDFFMIGPNDPSYIVPKPDLLPKMLEIASRLSKGFPEIRIDFYIVNNHLYFGEFTFFHSGGLFMFYPDKFDEILGNDVKLPPVIIS